MLIATILSQNTNDRNSYRAYQRLRKRFPTWDAVAQAPRRSVASAIRIGGMANQKSGHIRSTLKGVRERFGAYALNGLESMPDGEAIELLTGFDGVGVKTAACVLLFSLRRDVFPVDTHIHRICSRLGLAPGCTTPEKTYRAMARIVPAGESYALHTNLIRFGRMVCRSTSPSCERCPLFSECLYEKKKRSASTGGRSRHARHDFMLLDNVG
jgi:endonuclease-3